MQARAFLAAILPFLVITLLGGGTVLADQTDPKLDQLFADLQNVGSENAARPIEAQIWAIWLHSENQTVNDLMAVGVAQLNRADYARALATFDRVVALAPNFAEGWNKRATTLYGMGRFADSKRDIDRVLALEPRHFGALSGLGLCNVQLNRTREALDAFRRARAIDPNLAGIEHTIDELNTTLEGQPI
jgi:tetratricopeptide (TPR) repeat protein